MIWIYILMIGIVIGIYGIYIGLGLISQIIFPVGVLKVDTSRLSMKQLHDFREEWIKINSTSKLIILDHSHDLKFEIGNKRLKDL